MHFSGKTVLITGASSGIGREMALQLEKKGAKLILASRNIEKLENLRQSLINPEKHFVQYLDYENYHDFPAIVSALLKKVKSIDILVNNAGVSQRSSLKETPIEIDEKLLRINYLGNIALTKALLPMFLAQGSAQIIVISSLSGKFGFFLRSTYSAAKHALQGFYETLRLEHYHDNISILLVFPGFIKTQVSENSITATGATHGIKDENHKKGMEVSACVSQIISAAEKDKYEIVLGPEAKKAWFLRRFFPSLFWKIISKRSGTGS
jgi:dehydrogenase/reductase SDR family protein 7B